MAKFYFHLWNGSKFEIDDIGVELAFAEHAYLEACQAAFDIWGEMANEHKDASCFRYLVTDQRGRLAFDVPFTEAVAPAKATPKMSAEYARSRHRALASELAREIEHARDNIARSKEILMLSQSTRAEA